MKKLKVLLLVVMVAIMTTGCGKEKTLTCSNTQSESGVSMEQKVTLTFNNNKVNHMAISMDAKADSDLIKQGWSTFATTLETTYKDQNKEGVKVTTKNDDKNYVFNITFDIDLKTASKESLNAYGVGSLYGIADQKSNIDDVKKAAEASGFSCK